MLICEGCGEQHDLPVKTCPVCGGGRFTPKVENLLLEMQKGVLPDRPLRMVKTGFRNFDVMLGGGIQEGNQLLVLGGSGVMKTSLALKIASNQVAAGEKVLFVSNEMSESQIRAMAKRYEIPEEHLPDFLFQASISDIEGYVRKNRPTSVVVDSLQTISNGKNTHSTWNDIMDVSERVTTTGKKYGYASVVLSMVNRDGSIAGSLRPFYNADIVVRLSPGTTNEVIGTCEKNRQVLPDGKRVIWRKRITGPVESQDTETGYILRHDDKFQLGFATFPTNAGREMTVDEITVSELSPGEPLVIEGVSSARAIFLAAMLKRFYPSLPLNFAIKANKSEKIEQAGDLALVVAILSQAFRVPIPVRTTFFGSLDAAGKLLVVPEMELRTQRAGDQGYTTIIGPRRIGSSIPTWTEANDLRDVISLLGLKPTEQSA